MNWNDDLGFLLNVAARLSKGELNKKLRELNVTLPQYGVIKYLNDEEKRDEHNLLCSPANIAHRLRHDRPTITGIIDRLVRQGWVSRITNPADRRSLSITLTEKSKEFIEQMNIFCNDINDITLKDFNESEISNLKDYLFRIIRNLDKEGQFKPPNI